MSGMTSERLAEVRERQELRQRQANAAHAHSITFGPSHLWSAMRDADVLLAHVDHLAAENARLREGIAALAETGEADGRGNSRDLARHLRSLLNPPTEGEDHE